MHDAVTEIVDEIRYGDGCVKIEKFVKDENVFKDCLKLYEDDLATSKIIETESSHRVKGLLRAQSVVDMIDDAHFLEIIEGVISSPIILGGASLNVVLPNSNGMGFHRDYPYLSIPDQFDDSGMQPLVVQVIIALTDFTAANGATRYIKNSRLFHDHTEIDFSQYDLALMKAGDAMIMHGGTWHAVDRNFTDQKRVALLLNFHPYWVKPINTVVGITGEGTDRTHFSDKMKSLLGFNFTQMFLDDIQKISHGVLRKK